jgi:protein-L-isoaspartate O-methyltransferase
VLDLGAGTGTAVAFLSRQGQLCVEGVEHAWLPWLISTTRLRLEGSRGKVIRGDMMAWPLQGYDVVYAFLSPAAMPSLWDKAKREMRSGALLVSNSFEVPGVVADRVIECDPTKGRRLYIWQMP